MSTAVPALPAELSIYTVADCRTAWLNWLEADTDAPELLELDAATVQQCDSAGVQLLLSLAAALAARRRGLRLRDPGPPLREACNQLGLESWLDALTAQEVPA